MDRASNQQSPRKDDEMKAEMQGMLQGSKPTRVEEDHDLEPPADDDPEAAPFGPQPRDADQES